MNLKWFEIARFLPSQRYEPQRFPTVSRCTFKKKMGLRGKFFLPKNGGLTILAWSCRAAPDCFRQFPTVSVSLERQLDLWTTDSTKITTFNTFPHDPSARRLLEMMHFDFETQDTLKIPKPQDLVKFNNDVRMISHDILWVWVKIDPKEYMPNAVNPGLINPKRLFNWGGYRWSIRLWLNYDYWRSTPLINKPWFINPGLTLLDIDSNR